MIIQNVEYQPRFKAFLLHNRINVGDEIKLYEFIIWCNKKCSDFMKIKNIKFLNENSHAEFTDWLYKTV